MSAGGWYVMIWGRVVGWFASESSARLEWFRLRDQGAEMAPAGGAS